MKMRAYIKESLVRAREMLVTLESVKAGYRRLRKINREKADLKGDRRGLLRAAAQIDRLFDIGQN